ncbi:MAG TPA: Fn3-like domain-containing protein [Kofleriaceae bacterium]|jgi:hypothetical protein
MKRFAIVAAIMLSAGAAAADGLSLSPAVVPLGGKPGQSTQQRLSLSNTTSQALGFKLVAEDVVVKDGERVFVAAGDERGSIAATAVFSQSTITVPPHEQRSVDVTITLPAKMTNRAIVVLFQGTTRINTGATVALGSLITFELAGRLSISPGELHIQVPTASTNALFTIPIANDGTEPAVVRGAAAILDDKGVIVGKIALEQRRLLPGERNVLRSDYPRTLASGSYRVVATVECFHRSWTRMATFQVP